MNMLATHGARTRTTCVGTDGEFFIVTVWAVVDVRIMRMNATTQMRPWLTAETKRSMTPERSGSAVSTGTGGNALRTIGRHLPLKEDRMVFAEALSRRDTG